MPAAFKPTARQRRSPKFHGCSRSRILFRGRKQRDVLWQAQRLPVPIQRSILRPLRPHGAPKRLVHRVIVSGHAHAARVQRCDACTRLLLRLRATHAAVGVVPTIVVVVCIAVSVYPRWRRRSTSPVTAVLMTRAPGVAAQSGRRRHGRQRCCCRCARPSDGILQRYERVHPRRVALGLPCQTQRFRVLRRKLLRRQTS